MTVAAVVIELLGCVVCFGLLFTFDWLIIIIQLIIVLCGIVVFYAMKAKIETKTSRFKELEKES